MTDWQPIESAPKDGTYMLLYMGSEQHSLGKILVGCWADHPRCRCWIAGGYMRRNCPPTHWAPLPEPPQNG